MDYYDLVLALIPLALVGLTTVLAVGGLSVAVAVPLAGSVSAGPIGHATFVSAPVSTADAAPKAA